jgi:hypothetical protein
VVLRLAAGPPAALHPATCLQAEVVGARQVVARRVVCLQVAVRLPAVGECPPAAVCLPAVGECPPVAEGIRHLLVEEAPAIRQAELLPVVATLLPVVRVVMDRRAPAIRQVATVRPVTVRQGVTARRVATARPVEWAAASHLRPEACHLPAL